EEAGINFSAERAMEALQTVRLVTFRMDDRPERRGVSGGCPDACRVLKALNLTDLKPPTPPEGEETVALPFFGASIPGFVGLLTGRGPFSPAFALIPGRSETVM
ncbi:MAG: hypothetical protein ACLQU5_34535, partial [Isosphaeraceae bacterium]